MKHIFFSVVSAFVILYSGYLRIEYGSADWWALATIPACFYFIFAISFVIDSYAKRKWRRQLR